MKIDLHNHTSTHSSCSIISPNKLIETYINNGIDGIAITDHNYMWTYEEQEKLKKKYGDQIQIFFGTEVDTEVGHVLVFSTKYHKFSNKELPMTLKRLEEIFFRDRSVFILAHPFRWRDYCEDDPVINKFFDAIELYNGNLQADRIRYTYEKLNNDIEQFTAGSDTHSIEMAGKYTTNFSEDINSIQELIEAIKKSAFSVDPVTFG